MCVYVEHFVEQLLEISLQIGGRFYRVTELLKYVYHEFLEPCQVRSCANVNIKLFGSQYLLNESYCNSQGRDNYRKLQPI